MNIINAEMRDPAAKAKQLRRSGIIPCVISGANLKESLPIQIEQNIAQQLKRTKRDGSKIDIQVDNQIYHTLIKNMEYSTMNDSIIHISFHILDAEKKINSVADIVLLNKEKVQGILEQLQMKIPHAAMPEYLLDTVTVDLANLPIGTVIRIKDIPEFQSDKIESQVDPDTIVLRIKDKKRADTRVAEATAEEKE